MRASWTSGQWIAAPALAQSLKAVTPSSWRIELRDGLKWSDGTSFTAADVIESWKQVISRCRAYPAAMETFGRIEAARAFCHGRAPFSRVGIKIEDARHFRVWLTGPAPDFPMWLASPAAWPFHAGLGLGPFRPGETADRFERNPFYFGSATPLDGIELMPGMKNATHRVQSFFARESDAVDGLSESTTAALAGDPRLKSFAVPTGWFLVLPPGGFDEIGRRSLIQAVDPAEILPLLHWPHYRITRLIAAPAEAPVPSWAIAFAPESAAKHLSALPDRHAPLLHTVHGTESATPAELAANLQAQWGKRLGLSPSSSVAPGLIVEATWNPLHPETDLKRWLTLYGERWGHNRVRALEEKLADADWSPTLEEKNLTLQNVEKDLVQTQAMVLPLLGIRRQSLVAERVSNLSRDILGNWDFRTVDLED